MEMGRSGGIYAKSVLWSKAVEDCRWLCAGNTLRAGQRPGAEAWSPSASLDGVSLVWHDRTWAGDVGMQNKWAIECLLARAVADVSWPREGAMRSWSRRR